MNPARVLISTSELRAGVHRLAGEISASYGDGVVLVAVLKGSVPFLADLVRSMTINPEVDFLAISAYTPGTGRVRIVKDLDIDIAGRDVVLIEDIVDTGLTLAYILAELAHRGPGSLAACCLLDRATRRIAPTPLRFVGFTIEDDFAIGYGLDYEERYRNLEVVAAGDLSALREDPDAHVAHLLAR